MNKMITDRLLEVIKETEARYAERKDERGEKIALIQEGKILEANPPELVQRRFDRLKIDPRMVTAMLSEGLKFTSSQPGVSPQAVPRTLERVLGTNDLMGYGVFTERLVRRGQAVARIQIKTPQNKLIGYGTGFMVSSRLLLTNNHVFENAEETIGSLAEFNFQSDEDGQLKISRTFRFAPEDFFLTDKALDFTLVALQQDDALSEYGWIPLIGEIGKLMVGECVNIIQHPNGEPKQLSIKDNQVVDELELFLHYKTDTAPGSSGSPVFNDQWELVALHHSGVPKRDRQGNILTTDGRVWQDWMGEQRITWKANEGIRISRLVSHFNNKMSSLESKKAKLLNEALENSINGSEQRRPENNPLSINTPNSVEPSVPQITEDGSASWILPLKISVSLGQQTGPLVASVSPTKLTTTAPVTITKSAQQPDEPKELLKALEELAASSTRLYYDEAADTDEAATYYSNISADTEGRDLFNALSELVQSTHQDKPRYMPAVELYPWVDLHPDLKIYSIYSGDSFEPEELIREDFRIGQERAEKFKELMLHEADMSLEKMEYELDLLERNLPYNCEHVVPQSWFNKQEPMRGDLHHLFACEVRCNSFRSNTPYYDFTDFREATMAHCGKNEAGKFEPKAGKGAVARAVLYFLLRYPGQVGNEGREMQKDRLPFILSWHKAESPSEYERHRNQAIFEKQGNRNPFIDHPEWAETIDFELGIG